MHFTFTFTFLSNSEGRELEERERMRTGGRILDFFIVMIPFAYIAFFLQKKCTFNNEDRIEEFYIV